MSALLNIFHSAALTVASSLALIGGIFINTNVVVITPPPRPVIIHLASSSPEKLAMAEIAASTSVSEETAAASSYELNLPKITPGLLPKVRHLSFAEAAMASGEKGAAAASAVSSDKLSTPAAITPKWLLDNTSVSLSQNLDGYYRLSLTTSFGDSKNFAWNLSDPTIGGDSIPQFAVAYSCNPLPPPNQPPGAIIFFDVRTPYVCDVSLTDNRGRAASRQFSFKTGPGELIVTTASGMDVVLKDDKNENGFVFNNRDSIPISLSSITFDVSFTALSTSTPLAVRFLDATTGDKLAEYPLNDLPPNILYPYTYGSSNVKVGLNFNAAADTQKMVLVQALGVHKTTFLGVNPEIKVALKSIGAISDAKMLLSGAVIDWTCQVDNQPYDPERPANLCTQ